MGEQIEIHHGMERVFKQENLDSCACFVQQASTESMAYVYIWLHIDNPYSLAYLYFGRVRYFAGSSYWRGANFKTASLEERNEFIDQNRLHRLKSASPDYYLFINNTSNAQVKILADGVFYSDEIGEYRRIEDEIALQRIRINPDSGEPGIVRSYQASKGGQQLEGLIPVAHILHYFEMGYRHDEILAKEPHLEPEDIQACLVYARKAIEKK